MIVCSQQIQTHIICTCVRGAHVSHAAIVMSSSGATNRWAHSLWVGGDGDVTRVQIHLLI